MGKSTATTATDLKITKERDRRREILDVAGPIFLEQGFEGASMSEIAARVGGSKATLYAYFRSKDELFVAFMADRCDTILKAVDGAPADGDLKETLCALGRRFLGFLLTDDNLATFRVGVAEAPRYPEVARAVYEAGPAEGKRRLAEFLRSCADRGGLRLPDPELAAEQFLQLCQTRHFKMRLFGLIPEPSEAEIADAVSEAVDTFLAAYGARD